jgi:hypothetical protein
MWRFHATRLIPARVFLVGALSVAVVVGLAACDSGGSNSENEETVAQTFTVTVESIEGTNYPYGDQNNVGVAYAIDGEVGAEITLERGKTYEFELGEGVESGPNGMSHPFYVGTTAEGGGGDEYDDGVENAEATSGTVTFTPPSEVPDQLYYQCSSHVYMGGDMSIVDSSDDSNSGGDDGY